MKIGAGLKVGAGVKLLADSDGVDAELLGFGASIGKDGVGLTTPIFDVKIKNPSRCE